MLGRGERDGGAMSEFGQVGVGLAGAGQYVFTDLAQLDGVISEWTAIRDRVVDRGLRLVQAAGFITPPAEDTASQGYTKATRESVLKAVSHCDAMRAYADGYIQKLVAARAQYAETEVQTATNIRQSGDG
jgi:hypothetical protein